MIWSGLLRPDLFRSGPVRFSPVYSGPIWSGTRFGQARSGLVPFDLVWLGSIRFGSTPPLSGGSGPVLYGHILCGLALSGPGLKSSLGVVWSGVTWSGSLLFDLLWSDSGLVYSCPVWSTLVRSCSACSGLGWFGVV